MTTLTSERIMARRGESRRNDISVKIDGEVVRKARIAAEFEGKSLAAYLSDTLAPIVDADLSRHSRRVLEGGGEQEQDRKARGTGTKGK